MSVKWNLNDRMAPTKLPVVTAVIIKTCAKPSNTWDKLFFAFFTSNQIDYILYIIDYNTSHRLQLLSSLSNYCHWAVIIDIAILKLFEPPSYDFYFYNDLEHDIVCFSKVGNSHTQRKNWTTAALWPLDFDSHLGKFCTQWLVILINIFSF